MIYTLTDFICLDISVLFIFLVFCLSDSINNCKPNVDIILKPDLAISQNKIPSPHLPDSESLSFRTHA